MARVTKIKAPKFTGPNNTTRIKPGQARRKKPGSGSQTKLPGKPDNTTFGPRPKLRSGNQTKPPGNPPKFTKLPSRPGKAAAKKTIGKAMSRFARTRSR